MSKAAKWWFTSDDFENLPALAERLNQMLEELREQASEAAQSASAGASLDTVEITWDANNQPTELKVTYTDETIVTYSLIWTGGLPTRLNDETNIYDIAWSGGLPVNIKVD